MRISWGLMIAAVLALGATGFGESLWVKSESVDLRGGEGAVYPAVGSAKKGTELTVVSRDGKWVQVQAGGIQGWVYEGALSPQKVSGDNGLFSGGTPGAAQMSTGAAAKGLEPSAESYVQGKRLNKQPLEALIAFRKTIPPQDWQKFVNDGKLNK